MLSNTEIDGEMATTKVVVVGESEGEGGGVSDEVVLSLTMTPVATEDMTVAAAT